MNGGGGERREGRGGGEYGSGVRKGWGGELMRGEGRWGKGVDEMR